MHIYIHIYECNGKYIYIITTVQASLQRSVNTRFLKHNRSIFFIIKVLTVYGINMHTFIFSHCLMACVFTLMELLLSSEKNVLILSSVCVYVFVFYVGNSSLGC
jgi:hypothetical protein